MNNPPDVPQKDRGTTFPTQLCPLCGDTLEQSQYPRNRILLEDGDAISDVPTV